MSIVDSTFTDQNYTFELETSLQYEVVQSINAYSTATLEMSDRDSNYIHRNRSYNERRALKDLVIERDTGDNILKGEIS